MHRTIAVSRSESNAFDFSLVPVVEYPRLGHRIVRFATISSTNDALRRLAASIGDAHGTVIVSAEQVAGRGRLGRNWVAPTDTALLSSTYVVGLEASIGYAVIGLAVRDAITSVAPLLEVGLKWPNDVMISSRKVAGILIESEGGAAIVGIGINTNVPRGTLDTISKDVTSILEETGASIENAQLLSVVLVKIEGWLEAAQSSGPRVFAEWKRSLSTLGQQVEVTTLSETWTGIAVDVVEDGALLVTRGRLIEPVYAADVTLAPTA
jgi:BirA family biotin operon repressor/biotin-[acetyl-CoA-carboxylase] ligase